MNDRNKYMSGSNWTLKTPRSMAEAFGPYCVLKPSKEPAKMNPFMWIIALLILLVLVTS